MRTLFLSSGGLNEINRTGFSAHLKQAIENGMVYLGISAGSMIAAGNFATGLGYLKNLHLQEKR